MDEELHDDDNPEWDETNTRPLDAAAKLKHARVFLEMTQKELAGLIDTPVATLRNWEQRRTEPDPIAKTLIDLLFIDPKDMRTRLFKRIQTSKAA